MIRKNKAMSYILVVLAALLALFPFIMLTLSSFNTSPNIKKGAYFPHNGINNIINNFDILIADGRFVNAFFNTFLISVITTVLTILISLLFCYVIYRTNNAHIKQLIKFLALGILIPTTGTIVPLFTIVSDFKLLNTFTIVIFIGMPLSLSILLIYLSSKKFPYELIDAARVDGVEEHRIFYYIFLKGMYSTVVIVGITAFISGWNNLLIPLVFLDSNTKITLPVFLSSLNSKTNPDLGVIMLSLLLNTLPPIILFLILQKKFREGFDFI